MSDTGAPLRPVPWGRFLAEAVLIIVSILLAFAIDAMWEERQLRAEEQRVLRSMRRDFSASRENLAAVIASLARNQDRFEQFQALSPAEVSALEDPPSPNILTTVRTFDPYMGTVDALVGAGKLDLISDLSLRAMLGVWLWEVGDLREEAAEARAEALRVHHALESHGGPFALSLGDVAPRLAVLPEVGPATMAALRSDESVMGAARSHHRALAWYLYALESLQPTLDSTLVLIESNIR